MGIFSTLAKFFKKVPSLAEPLALQEPLKEIQEKVPSTVQALSEPKTLPLPELTTEQLAIREKVWELVLTTKRLVESDWAIGTREEKHQRAIIALSSLFEAERLVNESKFINFTFHGRDGVIKTMTSAMRKTQPLHKPSSDGHRLVAIIDTETTGVEDYDEPISVGALLVEVSHPKGEFLGIVESYHGKREPTVKISAGAHAVHGMTFADLKGAQFDIAALQKITDSASLLIAHNAKFDRRMLAKVMPEIVDLAWACSIHSLKYEWSRMTEGKRSLDAICSTLEIERPSPHNAMNDCLVLLEVLKVRAGKTTRSQTLMGRLIGSAWAPPP